MTEETEPQVPPADLDPEALDAEQGSTPSTVGDDTEPFSVVPAMPHKESGLDGDEDQNPLVEEPDALPASEYYRQRRRDRALRKDRDNRRKVWLFGLVGLVVVLLLAVGAEFAFTAGRIHPGVTVAGVDVGGMRRHQASAKLASALAERASDPVVVRYRDVKWTVSADKIGLGFDEDAQVGAAMAVGRQDNLLDALGERLLCWMRGVDVSATPTTQSARMEILLDQIAKKTDVEPVNATVKVVGSDPQVVEGEDGLKLDRSATAAAIVDEFTRVGRKVVEAPVKVEKRRLTAAEAREAADQAKTMLSGPVTVTFESKKWQFSAEEIGIWLEFRAVESSVTSSAALEPFVSVKKASGPVTKALGTKIGRPAKDATFEASNGLVTIIPSEEGIGPDVENLALSLTQELKDSSADRVVELRTSRTQPAITTEKAKKMGIKERISSYTTTYSSGNRPRVNNIHLLGDALDGTLIPPGGIFSFNETAGERTAAKGYQEAGAIVNGKLVPQLGGGVCQVGTTIFNTVFMSGLPVVERHNHSFYISHYPTGRDATVSWGGPDFKFKNDTPNWVLIVVGYSNSSITIALYGTDPGYEVASQVGSWTNVRPFRTEEVEDPTMYVGMKSIEDGGESGRSITVKRIVSKDGKVLRTDSFTSNYKPKVEIVRVGTKPRPSTVPTPTP